VEIGAIISLLLVSVIGGSSLERAEAGLDGGRIGWGLSALIQLGLEQAGFSSQYGLIAVLSIMLAFVIFIGLDLSRIFVLISRRSKTASDLKTQKVQESSPAISEAPIARDFLAFSPTKPGKKKRTVIPPEFRKSFKVEKNASTLIAEPPERDERLPELELLTRQRNTRPNERNINMTAGLIEKTLSEFGIPAKVVGFKVGPTVTQFAVEPGYLEKEKSSSEGDIDRQKIRVAQISGLRKDLALALSAERLRIEAPVPGRAYIGIEVPNPKSSVVRLKPILESDEFHKVGSPLSIALGRDVSGLPIVSDLGSMPHLLIAGTTGSGKSVCIAAITTCLVMNNPPEDLRVIMVDPKMVELVRFNGLPHLIGQVETDIERILGVLRWVVQEMDRRYKLLETSRSRNIDTYNRKMRRRKDGEILPNLVVLIDELADLMMSAPDQTEHNLVRLAQMARATGIHLVLATQRPSTDVVTGLIKANFPARISFAVASSVDSRVILDAAGAESLLGQGDMLFLPPEAPAPIRSQGVMVDDNEVERVISFWQKEHPTGESEKAPWEELLERESKLDDRDKLVEQAIEIVRKSRKASASMLQRKLRVGYPRAARLIDQLEELGIVGPAVSGGRDREVLISEGSDLE
jgi:S-DNA-T family DNA segregation ATPase FtsK/SpoIIIE